MSDCVSPEKRHWMMSRIRGKDTSLEVAVRRCLFAEGFRFRKNVKKLPGTPDIVLKKYRTVIFVNGCFWHHHEGCKRATMPATNTVFWNEKFARNIANDQKHREALMAMGWHVIELWECEIKKDFDGVIQYVVYQLRQFELEE